MFLRKHLAVAAAALVLSSEVLAVPSVEALVGVPDTDTVCRVHVGPPAEPGSFVVLQWSPTRAAMRIDGQAVTLEVQEQNCRRNCVGPGRTGIRVYRFRGAGVRASLQKQVSCARHAEVCSGLAEGAARLSVTTPRGTKVLDVRNEYCDL